MMNGYHHTREIPGLLADTRSNRKAKISSQPQLLNRSKVPKHPPQLHKPQ